MTRLTLCQDLPLAGLCTTVGWDSPVELLEQILHLTSALAFCEFVTDSKFWSAAVVARTCVGLVLDGRDSVLLVHAMVMMSRCVIIEPSLAIRKTFAVGEDAASDGGGCVAVGPGNTMTVGLLAARFASGFFSDRIVGESPSVTGGGL